MTSNTATNLQLENITVLAGAPSGFASFPGGTTEFFAQLREARTGIVAPQSYPHAGKPHVHPNYICCYIGAAASHLISPPELRGILHPTTSEPLDFFFYQCTPFGHASPDESVIVVVRATMQGDRAALKAQSGTPSEESVDSAPDPRNELSTELAKRFGTPVLLGGAFAPLSPIPAPVNTTHPVRRPRIFICVCVRDVSEKLTLQLKEGNIRIEAQLPVKIHVGPTVKHTTGTTLAVAPKVAGGYQRTTHSAPVKEKTDTAAWLLATTHGPALLANDQYTTSTRNRSRMTITCAERNCDGQGNKFALTQFDTAEGFIPLTDLFSPERLAGLTLPTPILLSAIRFVQRPDLKNRDRDISYANTTQVTHGYLLASAEQRQLLPPAVLEAVMAAAATHQLLTQDDADTEREDTQQDCLQGTEPASKMPRLEHDTEYFL